MLLTEGNPEAIHFNVNKKLAQLNKVINIFQADEEERIFRKQYLHKKYDPKFIDIMNKHSEKMDIVNQKMKSVNNDSNSKFYNIYHSKYESLKRDFKETISRTYDKHNSQIERQDKTVSLILNTLKKIDNDINIKYNPVTIYKELSQLIENLKQIQDDSKQQLQKEISDVHDKSSIQLKEYKEAFKNRITELKTQHKQKLKKIQSSHLEKIQQIEKNKTNTLNQRLDTIKKIKKICIKQSKSTILQMLEDHKSMISNEKQKISTLIKEYNDDILKFQKELTDHKKTIKKKINEVSQMSKTINQEINEKKSLFRAQKDELIDTLTKVQSSNKKEFDDKNGQFILNQQSLKLSVEKVKNQLKTEFDKTKENLNGIANSKSSQFKENEKKYNDLIQLNNEKLNQLKSIFHSNKFKHSSEIEENKNKYGQIILEIRQNHFNTMKKIQSEITGIKEKAEKQKSIYFENIKELNKQKEDFIAFSYQQQQDDKKDFNQRIDNLLNLNNEQAEKVTNEEELKLQNFLKSNEEQIESHRQNLLKNKEKFILNQNEQIKRSLSIFEEKEKNSNQKIIDEFNSSYQEKERKLNEDLESISIATNSEDQIYFQNLTTQFEQLQQEKDDLIKKNSQNKEDLLNSFKKLNEDENKRHFSFLSNLSKNNNGRNNRQKVLSTLKNQINQTIEDRNSQVNKLKEDKEKMRELFERTISNLGSQKVECINNSQIEESNLLKEIEELTQNMSVVAENRRKELDNQIINKKKEIDSLNVFYLNEKDDIYHKNSSNLAFFDEEYKRLSDIYNRTHNLLYSKFSEESKNKLNRASNLSQEYYQKQKIIKARIRDLSESTNRERAILNDKVKRNLSQNLDRIAQFEKSAKFNIQKMKDDNEGLIGFLDEKIEVLEKRLNEIKSKSRNHFDENKQIEILTRRLNNVTNALNHALSDLTRYKTMALENDKKRNTIFEKPNVGVIPS